MERYLGWRRQMTAISLAAAFALAACGQPIPSMAPSDVVAASVSPDGGPRLTQDEVDEAIRFRTRFGLRADEGSVRSVGIAPLAQPGVVEFEIR